MRGCLGAHLLPASVGICAMIYSRYNPRFPLKFGAKVQKIFVFRKFFLSKNHADSEIFMPNFVVPRNVWDESWSSFLAYVKKKRAKKGGGLHNSKKCSNFAVETEDGVAGGAHAESFISKRKALYPAEH